MDKRAFKHLAITLLFSTLFLHSTYADNDTVTDEVNVTIPISCTLSGTGMDSHVTELQNTESDSAIGETIMKAYCNDNNGFSIYAIGFTDDEYGKTVLTDSSIDSTNDIITGTSTSGPTSNWAMKLSTVTNPTPTYPITIQDSFDSFHNIPNEYTKVAERTSGTDIGINAEGSTLKSTYQAYISPTQSAGTYVGQVKYTLVHPYNNTPKDGPIADCPANKICYSPNANDVEGTMGQQTIGSTATTATLLASNFSRTGYGFAGWTDRYDYTNTNGAKFYGPNETISFTSGQYSTTNGGLRLYAVWIESAGSIQDSTKLSQLCGTGQGSLTQAPTDGTANLTSVSALTDQRDNQTYAIAKLADGNCWMIENLRLEAEHTRSAEDIALAQGYAASATYGDFIGLADAETSRFSSSTVANSIYYSGTPSGTASIDIGTNNSPGYRIPRYINTNITNTASNPTNNNNNLISYGNYYNWHAALANNIFYNGINGVDQNGKTSETAKTSLCPSGWALPRGGDKTKESTNDFWKLIVKRINDNINPDNYESSTTPYYSVATEAGPISNVLRSYPNNFLYSGYIEASNINNRGSRGCYWTSTTGGNASYYFYITSASVYPGTNTHNAYFGKTIRCMITPNS